MSSIRIPDSLRAVCASHGLTLPPECEPHELLAALPAILQSVGLAQRQHKRELAKSALTIHHVASYVPNAGIVRSEGLPTSAGDPNQCLEALLPLE